MNKTYEIDGKKYIIGKLVLGQLAALVKFFDDLSQVSSEDNIMSFIVKLGDKLPEMLAVVLCEEGKSIRDKNMEELVTIVATEVDVDMAMEILSDFFEKTPLSSLGDKLQKLMEKVVVQEVPQVTGPVNG